MCGVVSQQDECIFYSHACITVQHVFPGRSARDFRPFQIFIVFIGALRTIVGRVGRPLQASDSDCDCDMTYHMYAYVRCIFRSMYIHTIHRGVTSWKFEIWTPQSRASDISMYSVAFDTAGFVVQYIIVVLLLLLWSQLVDQCRTPSR